MRNATGAPLDRVIVVVIVISKKKRRLSAPWVGVGLVSADSLYATFFGLRGTLAYRDGGAGLIWR